MECEFHVFGFGIHKFKSVHVGFRMYFRCWYCIRNLMLLF